MNQWAGIPAPFLCPKHCYGGHGEHHKHHKSFDRGATKEEYFHKADAHHNIMKLANRCWDCRQMILRQKSCW